MLPNNHHPGLYPAPLPSTQDFVQHPYPALRTFPVP
uniref:Uncharacterized protein n=1 Tax=Anguilla anguilla TaxID=7936 RepID=A0A0E9VLL5_ANGAN